jgi:hypothetical protein
MYDKVSKTPFLFYMIKLSGGQRNATRFKVLRETLKPFCLSQTATDQEPAKARL